MKRFFTFGLITLFLLSACAPSNQGSEPGDFFVGSSGVETRFIDSDSPPSTIYYYADDEDNTFDITIDIWNHGASFARGGVYLSGYDPNLIQVRGISPDLETSPFGSCGLSIGNIGFGTFGFEIDCDTAGIRYGRGDNTSIVDFSAQNFANAMKDLIAENAWDEDSLFGQLVGDADIEFKKSPGSTRAELQLNYRGTSLDLEYGSRGRLMIALFSAIDFTDDWGTEYLLAGDIPDFPGGDLAVVDWDANIVNWPAGLDQTTQTFLVTNCYLYTTHAAPVMCIDPAPFSEGEKVCTPGSYASDSGQGAPVAITSVNQENTPRQSVFTIEVANIGSGTVWDPGMIHKCSPYHKDRISSTDKNIVWLGQIRVSGDPAWLDCVPDDFIRLDMDTQKGYITCRYDIPYRGLRSAYQTPLVAELWYGYQDSMRKNVRIKRVI